MKRTLFGLILVFLMGCNNADKQVESTAFILDFSSQKKYVYSYSQSSKSEAQFEKDEPFNKTKSYANGNLNIRVKENNLANLSVTNLKANLITFDNDGVAKDTTSNNVPTMVIQNMTQQGTFEDSNHNILFDLIFPLPTKPLKVGETENIPLQIPFNANGSKLFVKGFNAIEYSGIKIIDGKECAVLNGIIDISQIETPEELATNYESSTTGTGTYYFSLLDKYFMRAEIRINMITFSKPKTEESVNDGLYGNMKNSSEIIAQLIEIEE
ncbi:MAG: hypothetical protein ABJN61_11665 [Flavobacteriaceae bacterium]|uniref:hypothetical protein n=1 Tax=Nonlabens ulvanivorans TaxID=906888 RepID=UPI003297F034